MSEGEEIKKGTPPSRISEVPLTPEEKSAEVDKALEAMKRSLERRLALKRPESKSDIPPVLDTSDVDASQEAQAQPIRKASVGGNMESKSNQITPKEENAGARKDLSYFVDGLSEGEEFVVKNKDQEPTSYWKKAGRRKGEVRLENAQGDHSRGDIIKILTKGGKLEKKDGVITGGSASVDTDADTSMAETIRMSQLVSALGELPDTDAPEVTALKKEGAELLAKKDKLTDDEVKEFEGKVNAILSAPTAPDQPLWAVKAIKRNLGGANPDTALDLNSDAAIALRREKLDQKERVNSLFNKLVQINTDESRALVEEALKLLAELTIQADEAKVKAFEEKAQTLINRVEKKERFELHEGDVFERTVDGKTEGIRITGLAGKRVEVYYKTNFKDGSKSDETFGTTIDKLQKELREEGFTRGSKMNFSESTRVDINLDALTAPDATFDEALAFQPLKPGEQAVYKGTKGDILLQRGAGDLYQLSDDEGESGFVYDEEHIRNIAQEEKWQRVGEVKPAKAEEPKTPDDPTKSKEEADKAFLDGLKIKVEEMRLAFVTTDYKQNSIWSKIKGIFGKNIGEERGDQDTQLARQDYEQALMTLQNAELGLLKTGGYAESELRKRMADMLQYYKYDERVSLVATRDQVKLENRNWWEKTVSKVENVGRWYNELPRWQKYAFAAVCLPVALTGGAALATGTVVARRALGSAGLAVGVDTYLASRSEKKRAEATEIQKAEDLEVLDAMREKEALTQEAYLARLDTILKKDIEALEGKFKKQNREAIMRRTLAWGGATAAMFGGSFLIAHLREEFPSLGGRSAEERARDLEQVMRNNNIRTGGAATIPGAPASAAGVERASVASTPASASSAPATALAPDRATSAPGTTTPTAPSRVVEFAPDKPVTPEIASIQKVHEVTSADGRGLWGILEKRLPDGFQGDKNRAIQSLENAMRARLDAMSPVDRAKLGFPKGLPDGRVNLDFIRPNDKIDFGALLTPQEIQDALEGKSVSVPNVAHLVDQTAGPGVASPVQTAVLDQAHNQKVVPEYLKLGKPMNDALYENTISRLSDAPMNPIRPEIGLGQAMAEDLRKYTDPEQFLRDNVDNPGQRQALKEAVGKLRMEIFVMNPGEGSVPLQYDYAVGNNSEKLGGTMVSQVLKDLKTFERFSIDYDRVKNPLHPDQMRELGKFMIATEKAFGPEIAQVQAGEDIKSYTSRMATAALRTGKAIKGFYIPGVANKLVA